MSIMAMAMLAMVFLARGPKSRRFLNNSGGRCQIAHFRSDINRVYGNGIQSDTRDTPEIPFLHLGF